MTRMTLENAHGLHRRIAMQASLLLALLGMAGCAQLDALRAKMHKSPVVTPAAAVTPPPAPAPVVVVPAHSLAEIVNQPLQHGRYAEGEKWLRQYLEQHPGDRTAQDLLHQVTADPRRWLGPPVGRHVVASGDSYSILAKRYLGDASLFLILARYNGSTNPSALRIGQRLRLPAPPHADGVAGGASSSSVVANAAPAAESVTAHAERLQRESVALLGQGHKAQALERLDQALDLDPRLPVAGTGAAALRQQLLAAYHQRAIVLYRDQQLDPAIALWDRVLAIDPGYEAAVIYRARAMELKRRLKQY